MTAQVLSWLALWGAAALYAIAMVAYAIRLARVADERGVSAAHRRAEVSVGAGAGSSAGVDSARGSDSAGGNKASTGDAADASAPRPDRTAAKALGIARSATLVGVILHGIGLLARGIEAGHVPWSTMYEYTITGSFVAVVVFLIVQTRRDISFLGAGVTGLATIALGLGLTTLYAAATGLQPALQSFWLVIHVSIAIIATGVFAVGFLVTGVQLMRDYREEGEREVEGGPLHRIGRRTYNASVRRFRSWGWLDGVPPAANLEALAFRLHAVGFVLWTFTVMAGAVWAEHAWGRYWGWDPKEVWSFVIWVIYAAYLHARTTQGWAGRRSAYLAIVGFIALIMNFTVVNLLFQGLHSYAGV